MARIATTIRTCFSLLVVLLCMAPSARASVAANASIVNQVTLSYHDGAGNQTIFADVTVTVGHVAGIPTLSAPPDAVVLYAGPATALSVTYQITAGGNGPDTYTLGSTVASVVNSVGATAGAPGSVFLGATILTDGSTTVVLQAPADGAVDNSVNGIEVGDMLLVGLEERTVTAVNDPLIGTATITLNSTLGTAPGAGVAVFERQQFSVAIASGTIVTAGTTIEATIDTTAQSAAGTAVDQVMVSFSDGAAALVKYVRNVTWPGGNGSGTGAALFATDGGNYDYFTDGVTCRPGDVLEYLIEAVNPGGPVANSSIVASLPTAHVTLRTGEYPGAFDLLYRDESNLETGLTAQAGDDQATFAGGTMTVNAGNGATDSVAGTIPGGSAVRITYRVTVNP